MCFEKGYEEQGWISLVLRAAMACLFAVAAISKFSGGVGATVKMFQGMFHETWLPLALVTPYAYGIPFAEALIAFWLLTGYKLRAAWVFTSLVLISLGLGLMAAKQSAADIYTYLLIACLGIYVSRYDHCGIGGK